MANGAFRAIFKCLSVTIGGASALSGCQPPTANDTTRAGNEAASGSATPASPTAIAPTPTPSVANYADKEGDKYFYSTAVSDEDREKGKAVGDVIAYRYLGSVDGVHKLEHVSENGARIALNECRSDCRIIKSTAGQVVTRIPFDTGSVIGSAFDDAIHGRLAKAEDAAVASEQSHTANTIPVAYRGEWNADRSACGTDLSDSRLRIDKQRVRFYESDGTVTRVTVHNARAITVNASFQGEGEVWNDSDRMTLSSSGKELTIDGLTRYKCA